MPKPSSTVVLAWSRLVRAHGAALGHVERALKDAGLPPLEWYDVLLELERAGPLRPRDLQGRLLLAQYNLSRLLDRMAAAGSVGKQPCAEDGRGHVVAITEEGRALRLRMWPVYARSIEGAVGERLSEQEAETLASILAKLTPGASQPG